MRTPRFFLGVFALALTLALLLLACGGFDEPTDGPTSERSTATPTTEGAEPSLTTGPTAAPTMAQTVPETDRAVLVALFNATDGLNWRFKDNWLSDAPIREWAWVTTDDNGRVTRLNLSYKRLSGEIPPALGNLASLQDLNLEANQLSGDMPPEFGNLASLTWLSLSGNQLSGEIPPELGNLANLN